MKEKERHVFTVDHIMVVMCGKPWGAGASIATPHTTAIRIK